MQECEIILYEIKRLCECNDLVFLQETWLSVLDIHVLSAIDESFYAKGISSMNVSEKVLCGRPYGGIAILWRKTLSGCKVIDMDDTRLMGFELSTSNNTLFFINVYLPCDSHEI